MGRRSTIGDHSAELIKLVRSGVSFADACVYRGIHESTFYRWKQIGENAKSGKYKEFYEGIRKAEVEAKIRKIGIVEKACTDDPKLALEVLARKYPKEWGRKQYIDMDTQLTGAGGGPIDVNAIIRKAEEEFANEQRNTGEDSQ